MADILRETFGYAVLYVYELCFVIALFKAICCAIILLNKLLLMCKHDLTVDERR